MLNLTKNSIGLEWQAAPLRCISTQPKLVTRLSNKVKVKLESNMNPNFTDEVEVYGDFLNPCDICTFVHLRGELAAGDPKVVGVLLGVERLQLQDPHPQVSIRGAADKQLTTWAEGAGHHSGVRHSTCPI